ncbi:MAG: hypothetical protein JO022_17855 [Acidobacteriaceae bacterium]|nr:hypothetical protein [Acidobacteriaceae bacterium]
MPEIRPTEHMVEQVVKRLDNAGQSVAGYCLDFGLIAFGEMSLIEMNDGIALTNYGISPADYLNLHLMRWQELVVSANCTVSI